MKIQICTTSVKSPCRNGHVRRHNAKVSSLLFYEDPRLLVTPPPFVFLNFALLPFPPPLSFFLCFPCLLCDPATSNPATSNLHNNIFFAITPLDLLSLKNVIPDVACCAVYVLRCQTHWIFHKDEMSFASTQI